MREHTDSIDTAYNRGLLARVAARNVKKKSVSTRARNHWKRVTTWLSKASRSRSLDSNVQHSPSGIPSITVYKKQGTPTPDRNISEQSEPPTSRLIRRGLKHYDSSGLPGTMDVYSKSELRSRRGPKMLSAGESSHIKPCQTPISTNTLNTDSQTPPISTVLNTRATTSESFDILPPMFDPEFKVYMNTRLEAIGQLREEDKRRESCCECLIS